MRRRSLVLAVLASVALTSACGGRSDDDGAGAATAAAPVAPTPTPAALPRYSLLVRDDPFRTLVIEIDAVPGLEPREQTGPRLAEELADLIEKPDGITATLDGALASRGADHAWTFDELQELAADSFDLEVPTDTIKTHMMFIDGHSAEDGDGGVILGLAWAHTHIAMFEQTIEDNCASVPVLLREEVCAGAELAISTHETGHLLGLVNNGLPMVEDHRDPDEAHGAHDASDQCVMYYAYEGQELFATLTDQLTGGGSAEIDFDDACRADLAAERAR